MKDTEDTSDFPALGRAMLWVDKPGSANKIFWALAVLCVFVFAAGFMVDMHGHFAVESFGGFYALYGFAMFTALILVAKALRVIIKRREDYYGDKAVDREDYPEDQLEKLRYDD